MNLKTGIIDYGSGNFTSVFNAVSTITDQVQIISEKKDFDLCDRIILPGVGTYRQAMDKLASMDIVDVLLKNVLIERKAFLGICVGMQILSENGFEFCDTVGLGLVQGDVKKFCFPDGNNFRLPHIGWNSVSEFTKNPLFDGITEDDADFYFVNSFHLISEDSVADFQYTDYGYKFISALQKDNIFGVQFHPEKSQHNGIRLLSNFINHA